MSNDGAGPIPVTPEMMGFATDLKREIVKTINKFAEHREIDPDEIPFQETLIALGSLVSAGVMQQSETLRPQWLAYYFNGVTTGTGLSFLIAYLPEETAAKMGQIEKKETLD
jgi:hypothetical protein